MKRETDRTGTTSDGYRKTILPGGIRVITEQVTGNRSCSIGVWIDAGSQNDPPGASGTAHFMEHLVFKGTRRRKTHQIARSLESIGGYLNAFTTKEHTCYYARVREEHVGRAMDVLSDLVLHPLLEPGEIEKEKQVILEEMKSLEEEPEEVIHDLFEHHLMSPHVLGQFIIGTEQSVRALKRPVLRAYARENYRSENILVAAAGSVHHETLVRETVRYFTPSRGGNKSRKRRRPVRPRRFAERLMKPSSQTHICIGRFVPGARSPRRFAMALLSTHLGEGMSSRLFQLIREKHAMAYSVYSSLSLFRSAGVFSIYFGTDSSRGHRCLHLIHDELERLRRVTLSNRELKRVKEQVKGNFLLGLESSTNRMMYMARGELHFDRHESPEEVLAAIDRVTTADIESVASFMCDTRSYSTMAIVPEETGSD